MHQRYAVEDDIESIISVRQPGRVANFKSGRGRAGAGAGDHGLRIVDASVGDPAGKYGGKHFPIAAAAAADLQQTWMLDPSCAYGFRGDLEIDPRFAALHGRNQSAVSAVLLRSPARGEP